MFRPMRRREREMTREECEEVLASTKRGVLSLLGDEGYPYGVPLDFVYWQGKLYFHCAQQGHKLDAIASYDKASFVTMDDGVLEEGSWWYHVRSVISFGCIRVVDPSEEAWLPALRALGSKYFPPEKSVDASIARSGSRVNVLELTIEHMSGKNVQEK